MSHAATNWALQQRGLKPATKIVLLQLADRHNPDLGCFPAQKTLAHDCEMSERSVRTHLEHLESVGLIERVQIHTGGTFTSTRYILQFEQINQRQNLPTEEFAAGKNASPPAAKSAAVRRQNLPTNPVTEPRKKPVSKKTRIPEDAVISERMIEIAEKHGHGIEEAEAQFERFKSRAVAKGDTYANWDAAWNNWFLSPFFKTATKGDRYDRSNRTSNQSNKSTRGGGGSFLDEIAAAVRS